MTTPSPIDARPARWRILSRYREGERTLAEWSRVFAGYPPEDFPLLKIEGSVATVVRCPDTESQLAVFRCVNGTFSARSICDSEDDTMLDDMTIEDVRLYWLDWLAHGRSVAQHLGLTGQIREMPELRWFWRIGELHAKSHHYAYFMAVIREDPDADIVAAALKTNPMARLIVPNLSDVAFHRLTEAKINFHVLADGTPPHFPDVATEIKGNATIRKVNQDTPAEIEENVFRRLGKKGDYWEIVFEGNELQPVRHLAGMTYIHALLSDPGKHISALSLCEIENPPPPEAVSPANRNAMDPTERERCGTGGSQYHRMDAKTRAAAIARKSELEKEIKDEDAELDIEEKTKIEDEIERLDNVLKSSSVALASGEAIFEDKERKQPRQAVAKAIGKAVDVLAKQSTILAKHLAAIRKGKTLAYTGGLGWKT